MPNSPIKIKTSALFGCKKKLAETPKIKTDSTDSSSDESPIKTKLPKKRNPIHVSPDSPPTSPDSPKRTYNKNRSRSPHSPKRYNNQSRSPSPENEALRQRRNNIKERDAFLASFLNDPEFAEAVESVGLFSNNKSTSTKPKSTKKRKSKDVSFRSVCSIPTESRKSLRLQDKQPVYTHEDLVDETVFGSFRKRKKLDLDESIDDLEKVVYKPKTKRKSSNKATERTHFLRVEDVTEAMLNKIARKVSEKVYSSEGTSCHQCRQKTTDTKTFCRSNDCIGVRGQFCGVCLLNRYGEDIAEALKDPNWHCPMCRGICNCSFCRSRQGKRPTGILTPLAHQSGHKSVKDFLDSLRGEGDYSDLSKDPKALLGFTEDLEYAQLAGGQRDHVGSSVYLDKTADIIASLEKMLLKNRDEFGRRLF